MDKKGQYKAVYIGAGKDVVRPIRVLPDVRTFIFVDSLPATQQPGTLYAHTQRDPTFRAAIVSRLAKLGFTHVGISPVSLMEDDADFHSNTDTDDTALIPATLTLTDVQDWTQPHVYTFVHPKTQNRVQYYFSYGFPNDLEFELATHLHQCTHLIHCGHSTHQSVLDFLPKRFTLVCFPGSYYGEKESEDTCLTRALYPREDLDIRLIYHRFWQRRYTRLRDVYQALDPSLSCLTRLKQGTLQGLCLVRRVD